MKARRHGPLHLRESCCDKAEGRPDIRQQPTPCNAQPGKADVREATVLEIRLSKRLRMRREELLVDPRRFPVAGDILTRRSMRRSQLDFGRPVDRDSKSIRSPLVPTRTLGGNATEPLPTWRDYSSQEQGKRFARVFMREEFVLQDRGACRCAIDTHRQLLTCTMQAGAQDQTSSRS